MPSRVKARRVKAKESNRERSRARVREKEKKAKAPEVLNKLQQEFKAALKTDYKDDKALFKFAKELGVTWDKKEDPRINRMKCVMAIKAHLGTQGSKKAKK